MFQWDKSIKTLDVPVGRVINLYRSMRDVQLALPGLPAQEARAYLCQYQTALGVGTATIFQLHKSGQLAFYVEMPHEVPADKADSMLDRAMVFVESMGFLMTDLDIHLMGDGEKEALWSSLPLQKGLQGAEQAPQSKPAAAQAVAPGVKAMPPVDALESLVYAVKDPMSKSAPSGVKVSTGSAPGPINQEILPVEADKNEQANVDDLLAAVEELRTRRPGVRARKKPPSPEELKRRRQDLRETVGHILASL